MGEGQAQSRRNDGARSFARTHIRPHPFMLSHKRRRDGMLSHTRPFVAHPHSGSHAGSLNLVKRCSLELVKRLHADPGPSASACTHHSHTSSHANAAKCYSNLLMVHLFYTGVPCKQSNLEHTRAALIYTRNPDKHTHTHTHTHTQMGRQPKRTGDQKGLFTPSPLLLRHLHRLGSVKSE